MRMAGDTMGKEAAEKVEMKRQVFPQWRAAGRWAPNSTSLLEHVQQQLSTFLVEMAKKMSMIKRFTNMKGNWSTRRTKHQRTDLKR